MVSVKAGKRKRNCPLPGAVFKTARGQRGTERGGLGRGAAVTDSRVFAACAECRDGVRTGDEECDDGNTFSGDGCSVDCILEDPAEDVYLCDRTLGQLTVCCPVLINPISLNKTCDCIGQLAVNPGTLVTPSCELQDIDECQIPNDQIVPNGLCHPNAVRFSEFLNFFEFLRCLAILAEHSQTRCARTWTGGSSLARRTTVFALLV